MRASLACVLSSGCFQTVHRPTCDEHAVDVADDEDTPEGRAEDLLANVVGGATADGVLAPDDAVVPVTWSITRREGSARWIESDPASEVVSREFGFGDTTVLIDVFCDDRLEAPVELAVSTSGGEVVVSVDTVVATLPDVTSDGWSVSGDGPYAEAVFPELPGVDPDEHADKEAFAEVRGVGGTGEVTGRAGWSGSPTESSRASHTVLEFPAPAAGG
jgi:hypothetical protein